MALGRAAAQIAAADMGVKISFKTKDEAFSCLFKAFQKLFFMLLMRLMLFLPLGRSVRLRDLWLCCFRIRTREV